VQVDSARTLITRNRSPDVPFDRSVNPYRGCEHGCIYCFARPSHAYLGLSPGLDFESRIFYKADAGARLRAELSRPGYRCAPLALGVNTDAYQPIERELRVTRDLLEVLAGARHPVSLITKSALIERDLDLLTEMARQDLVEVYISLTSLRSDLARRLEPRAASPRRRLEVMRTLAGAGVPVGVLIAPVIPGLTDEELEPLLEAAREAGAGAAGYGLLRLPHEVAGLFEDWLTEHEPLRAAKVMGRVQEMHGGRLYDARFGRRMRGSGVMADLLARRFELASRRLGYRARGYALDCSRFRPPDCDGEQLSLL
jgi:DNA repair photolyase